MKATVKEFRPIDTYAVITWCIWAVLSIVIVIEIATNDPFISRNTWVVFFTLLLAVIFAFCLILLFVPNIFERSHYSIVKLHTAYVLTLVFFFIPVLYGSAFSYNTVSDIRFAEYLNIFLVCSLPLGSIFLIYLLKYD